MYTGVPNMGGLPPWFVIRKSKPKEDQKMRPLGLYRVFFIALQLEIAIEFTIVVHFPGKFQCLIFLYRFSE